MTDIVVVMGSPPTRAGLSGLSGEASVLQRLLADTADPKVAVISLGIGWDVAGLKHHINLGGVAVPFSDRLYRAVGFYGIRDWLSRFSIGRLINSMGPLDQGRIFWRLVRRSAPALQLLKGSDVAIASDLAGVKTCWLAHRRGWIADAHYDYRAAGIGATIPIPEASEK